jgi:hypothetical protein
MSGPATGGGGSSEHPPGDSSAGADRARSGRGLAIVIVAVVIGVLLLPSATRAPLAADASTTGPSATTTPSGSSSGGHHGTTTTSTTIAPASIHVLVANATTVNGVAGAVTSFLASKSYGTLTATNSLVKVPTTEVFTVGGATADASAIAAALDLPATSIEPAASAAPVSNTTGANVVVIVGTDLATRFNPATTTTAPPG